MKKLLKIILGFIKKKNKKFIVRISKFLKLKDIVKKEKEIAEGKDGVEGNPKIIWKDVATPEKGNELSN